MQFQIDDQIFELFPELSIGVVSIQDADNSLQSPDIGTLLAQTNASIREEWSFERLDQEPRIQSWRDAYRTFKAKPKKYKSSIENLYAMILGGRELQSINTLVDLYNIISLKYLIPVGGDDLDQVDGGISLVPATGDERFIPLNGSESISPKPGEVIYRDATEVLCRRWNWRECDKSKLTENSKNVALFLEGLPPLGCDDIKRAANELGELVLQHCGGKVDVGVLDSNSPAIEI